MRIEFNPTNLSAETIIAFANALADDIDAFAEGSQAAHQSSLNELNVLFDGLCKAFESVTGLPKSDYIRCPLY